MFHWRPSLPFHEYLFHEHQSQLIVQRADFDEIVKQRLAVRFTHNLLLTRLFQQEQNNLWIQGQKNWWTAILSRC